MKKIANISPKLDRQGRPYITPTDKQREVLKYMVEHFDTIGYWPSISYLADKCGIAKTTLYERIQQLIRKGYIYKTGYNTYIVGINAIYYVRGMLNLLKDEEIM